MWVRLVIAVEVLAPVEIHVVGDDEFFGRHEGKGECEEEDEI